MKNLLMISWMILFAVWEFDVHSHVNYFHSNPVESPKILWQIAKDPDFKEIYLEETQYSSDNIVVSDEQIEQPGLHYLRIKSLNDRLEDWDFSEEIYFSKTNDYSLDHRSLTYYSVDENTLNFIQPYLLPETSPAKSFLDRVFSQKHLTSSKENLEKAGFKCAKHSKEDCIIVAKHPGLPGYVLKIFTDDQPQVNELENFLIRIQGAEVIKSTLTKFHLEKNFKVPNKWIYILPDTGTFDNTSKKFILVAQDMRVLSSEKNSKKWRSAHLMTPQKLDQIYLILTDAGLYDSVYADNIPFCRDGKMAFIDTEHFHKWPVPYLVLNKFLTESMQKYWTSLVLQGGSH